MQPSLKLIILDNNKNIVHISDLLDWNTITRHLSTVVEAILVVLDSVPSSSWNCFRFKVRCSAKDLMYEKLISWLPVFTSCTNVNSYRTDDLRLVQFKESSRLVLKMMICTVTVIKHSYIKVSFEKNHKLFLQLQVFVSLFVSHSSPISYQHGVYASKPVTLQFFH